MAENTEKVTTDQANEALQQLIHGESEMPAEAEAPAEAAPPEETETPQAAAEEQPVETTETAEEQPAEGDDLDSLRQRLTEMEGKEKDFQSRLRAVQDRNASNERILRDRYLRKSTVADRMLKALKAATSDNGADPEEVARLIREMESTMNPASASYSEVPEPPSPDLVDKQVIMNNFLNENTMTAEEADSFGNWIRNDAARVMTPTEQAVANESLGGFLQLAHMRWKTSLREQNHADTVATVKSVQRQQRQAARAASAGSGAAPRKTTTPAQAGDPVQDLLKLPKTQQNEAVAALLKQSIDQYR